MKGPNSRRKLLIIISGSAVLLLFLIVIAMELTSRPSFCASCHEIKPLVTAWAVNPHKDVQCLDCHADPGLTGYVTRKIGGLRELYLHQTQSNPVLKASINVENCIQCHTGKRNYPNAKNISLSSGALAPKVSHEGVLKAQTSCLACHRTVAHGDLNKLGIK